MANYAIARTANDGISLFEKEINNRSYAVNYFYRESVKAKGKGETVTIRATHADAQHLLSYALDNMEMFTSCVHFPKTKLGATRKAMTASRNNLAKATYTGLKVVEPFHTTTDVAAPLPVKKAAPKKATPKKAAPKKVAVKKAAAKKVEAKKVADPEAVTVPKMVPPTGPAVTAANIDAAK